MDDQQLDRGSFGGRGQYDSTADQLSTSCARNDIVASGGHHVEQVLAGDYAAGQEGFDPSNRLAQSLNLEYSASYSDYGSEEHHSLDYITESKSWSQNGGSDDDEEDDIDAEGLKNMFLSAWTNMKNGN